MSDTPYIYQEYPKMLYRDDTSLVVHGKAEQDAALSAGYSETATIANLADAKLAQEGRVEKEKVKKLDEEALKADAAAQKADSKAAKADAKAKAEDAKVAPHTAPVAAPVQATMGEDVTIHEVAKPSTEAHDSFFDPPTPKPNGGNGKKK